MLDSTRMKDILSRGPKNKFFFTAAHLLLIALLYIFFVFPVVNDSTVLPIHDNILDHLPNYRYFSGSLQHGFGFPLWSPFLGGIPIGVTALSFFYYLPHRILGYVFALLLPFDIITLYKMTLAAGALIMGCGWWLVLHKLTGSRPAATFGLLMILLGGTGITVFHQEQILSSTVWVPWTVLVLLKLRENQGYALPFCVLLGFLMTVTYPQLQILAILFLFLALALSGNLDRALVIMVLKKKTTLLVGAVLFFLAASPTVYMYVVQDAFSSPVRNTEDLRITSYDEYLRVNKMQVSSAPFEYLANYVSPQRLVSDDQFAFFVTVTGLVFAALGLVLHFRKSIAALIFTLLCAWATLGINGYIAQFLFLIRFPAIGYFRQWYHFVPMVNFGLSVLGAFGFSAVFSFFPNRTTWAGIIIRFSAIALVFSAVFFEGSGYFKSYSEKMIRSDILLQKQSKDAYINALSRGGLNPARPLMALKEWTRLKEICPDVVVARPFVTNAVFNEEIPAAATRDVIRKFCSAGLSDFGVVADIPSAEESLPPDMHNLRMNSVDAPGMERIGGPRFSGGYFFTPRGAVLQGSSGTSCLAVFPFGYKLKMRALLDGKSVKTYPVYGGAMTGVMAPPGWFTIELSMPLSAYEFSVLIQALLLIYIVVFSLMPKRKSLPSGRKIPRNP